MLRHGTLVLFTLVAVSIGHSLSAQEVWSRFRGPNGEGISQLQGVPTSWSESDYEWVVKLPGKGHSSPVIWKDTLFLTSGEDDGTRLLLCLDAITGETRWTKSTHLDPNKLHAKNSYGSGTPVTDGERVYVAQADAEHYIVAAYDMQGNEVWKRDFGPFVAEHGYGGSPVIYGELLIVPNDQNGPSSIEALDLKTGETRWSSPRKVKTASYATPMVLNLDGKDQLIVLSGAAGLAGLDPKTGEELWASGALPERTVGSPIFGNGLLFGSCGSGGRGAEMVIVDPSKQGEPEKLVHSVRKKLMPYVPTPVVFGDHLYLWNDDGTACCVDMQGDFSKNVWRERIGGNYSGSPVVIAGKIYCISEDGLVKVIDASPTFHEYPGGKLGDASYSTPAVANGRVYFRGFHTLSCLKASPKTAEVQTSR
ncbi:PQQ-binding-like beta-propeller repeat protein [Planctomicrobium sp. SH661]|uniref:PQQ-binding-like beta-propeller repeat protein n=1 Tax=Planctomicrobium sp. SH661 TaxID=3448124 RepID=UPI003F5B9351